jgi:methylated-DNA-[protein]-cysteine S-methyltransferase
MDERHWTSYETAYGVGGIVESSAGLYAVLLPAYGKTEATGLLEELSAGGKRQGGSLAAELIEGYFDGKGADFSALALDLGSYAPFERRIYQETAAIPYGSTSTYGKLALAIGRPGAARAVGNSMAKNRIPLVIP